MLHVLKIMELYCDKSGEIASQDTVGIAHISLHCLQIYQICFQEKIPEKPENKSVVLLNL